MGPDGAVTGHTAVEQRLITAVAAGEFLDLADEEDRGIRASVIRDLVRGRLVDDPDPRGVRLRRGVIEGRIDLQKVVSDIWLELTDCDLLGGVSLRDARIAGFVATGCRIERSVDAQRVHTRVFDVRRSTVTGGTVSLRDAQIGELVCDGARVENPAGFAADASNARIESRASFGDGFTATGAIGLIGARIGGELRFSGARLTNDSGPALVADRLQVGQSIWFDEGFTATADSGEGAVRLVAANIGGNVYCNGARMENRSGPALLGDAVQIDGDLSFRRGFTVEAASEDGAVRLRDARIGGELSCTGARLTNTGGTALYATGLHVGGIAYLSGMTASSTGARGTLHLRNAVIGSDLSCHSTTLRNSTGPALVADRLTVGGRAYLYGLVASGGGGQAVLDLSGTHIEGEISLDVRTVQRTGLNVGKLVALDGLTYRGLPREMPLQDWLAMLRDRTPGYAAQPYQQLAAAYRAAGHDHDARAILIAQRRDQLRRAEPSRSARLWGRLTGLVLGYGYQSWRALVLLLVTLVAAVTLSVAGGEQGGLARKATAAAAAAPCTTIEHVGVGLDLGTPLLKTGARDQCQPTDTTTGRVLTVAGWVFQLLAWTLATLFIAGFTSAVRKT